MSQSVSNLLRLTRFASTMVVVLAALGGGRPCLAGHEESKGESAHSEHAEGGEASDVKSSGIELGEFQIRSDYPAEAQKSTVRFVLFASVKGERMAEMNRLVEERRQKLRDEIITATRLAPLSVFEEPDLATFRRRILMRLRRTMPELEIDDLFFSDFGLLVRSL